MQCEYATPDSPSSGTYATPASAQDILSGPPLPAPVGALPQGAARDTAALGPPDAGLDNGTVLHAFHWAHKDLPNLLPHGHSAPTTTVAPGHHRASFEEASRSVISRSRQVDYRLYGQIEHECNVSPSQPAGLAHRNSSSIGRHGDEPAAPDHALMCGDTPQQLGVKRPNTSTTDEGHSTSTSFSPGRPDTIWSSTLAISSAVYDEIASLYRRLCIWPPAPWAAFEHINLPNVATFANYLRLYHMHFDQTLPFWHPALFARTAQHPVLVVAMSAIGCSYMEGSNPMRTSLLEFGRRCLIFARESTHDSRLDSVPVAAAQLLQIVGMAYSGQDNFRRRALDSKGELAQILDLCRSEMEEYDSNAATAELDDELAWLSWCRRECIGRLASSTWLVDSMMSYHFETKPSLGLRDLRCPLPCAEKIWCAKTSQEWRTLRDEHVAQPSLCKALQELFVDKYTPIERGEFARVMVIHGMYQRMCEVHQYYENPLSSWEPSSSRQSSAALLPKDPVCLSSIPAFTTWQSAACDALALMHWQANNTIGRANGTEHATVLHLHIARIGLLTPYFHVAQLARILASGEGSLDDHSAAEAKQTLQHWAGQHHRSARIATVHAGLVFWHLRRYTVSAYYEAHSVVFAALVLWAFAMFSGGRPHPTTQQNNDVSLAGHEDSEQSDDATCEIILIDRPTDEELVQQFIEHGHSMRIHMTGVEDLYGRRGPESVLVQGCKLLSSLQWGVSSTLLELLRRLTEVSRRLRESDEQRSDVSLR